MDPLPGLRKSLSYVEKPAALLCGRGQPKRAFVASMIEFDEQQLP